MASITPSTRRMNVAFPPDILKTLEKMVPARQRNRFVVDATERALRQAQLDRALDRLLEEAAWTDENHPDLETTEDVDRYVRKLRESWLVRATHTVEVKVEQNG